MDLTTLDILDEEDDIVNEETLSFHSNVRENIVSIIIKIMLINQGKVLKNL